MGIILGFIGFGFGLATVAFFIILDHNGEPDGWTLVGVAAGALTATWLQSKRNAKRNLKRFTNNFIGPGIFSMFFAGAFYGLVLSIIIAHLYDEFIDTWHLVTACLLIVVGVAVKRFKKSTPGSDRETKWTLGSDLKKDLGPITLLVIAEPGLFLPLLVLANWGPTRQLVGLVFARPSWLVLLTGIPLVASGAVWSQRRRNLKSNIPRNKGTVRMFIAATSFAPVLLGIIVALMGPLFGAMGLNLYYERSAYESVPRTEVTGAYESEYDPLAENKATSNNDLSAALRGKRLHFTIIGEIDLWADFHSDGTCYRGRGEKRSPTKAQWTVSENRVNVLEGSDEDYLVFADLTASKGSEVIASGGSGEVELTIVRVEPIPPAPDTETFVIERVTYEIEVGRGSSGTCCLVGIEDPSKRLVIPTIINGLNVIEVDFSIADISDLAEKIVLPATVETIGNGAFRNTSFKKVTLPPRVREIQASAFENCKYLETVYLPPTLETIGSNAFARCWRLSAITLPAKLTAIGNSAFEGCNQLEVIEFPRSLRRIGSGAFSDTSFKKVTLPPTVREIQASAFEGCKDLEIVNLSPALEKIGYKAFSNCPRLSAITLPATLTGIGDYAFDKSGIKSITLPPGEFSPRIGKAAFQGGVYMEAIKKQRSLLFGSLIDEAIPAKTLKRKPNQGEILYYPPNQQTPYTGWVKHYVRKGEDPSESRPRQSGRFVRIDHPGDNKMIHVAEVQVFRDGKNIARQGKATQSSTDFGGPSERAIDGNTDGNYKNNSVTHTAVSKDPWLEIDLGAISAVDKIVIWNRTDGQTQSRLDGSILSILDEKRETVWKQDYAKISVLTQYKDGRKDGREISWYKNGKKHWDVTFKENGRWFTGTWWYTNGQKVSEETYKDGKLWTARAWKINGDKCPDTNVIDGTGVRTQYHGVSGKRRWRQNFKDGQRIK